MANRFSDIAKQMGAKVDDEAPREKEQVAVESGQSSGETRGETAPVSKPSKTTSAKKLNTQTIDMPTTRKTTALPLVLDIAIKEVKERRNIASKINNSKKITEDDVVVEALEMYFKKAENKSFLEAAQEKIRLLR